MNLLSKSNSKSCSYCNFTHSSPPPFLTATKEELNKRPLLPKDLEDDLRSVARILRKRAESELEQELLQEPLKSPNIEGDTNGQND